MYQFKLVNWSRSNKEVTALSIPQTSCHLSLVCPVLSRVKSYTNEEKCEQWHQLRLAYSTDILQECLIKNGGEIRDWNYASNVGCLPSGLQDWEKTWVPRFSKVPETFRVRKTGLCLFSIKVSIILKTIKWNCQLSKGNWLVDGLGTVLLFNRFGF